MARSGSKRTAQFRYNPDADRAVVLDDRCKARCERKGFTIPAGLLGKRVMRDPSTLPRGYAVRFGWPAVAAAAAAAASAVPADVAAEAMVARQTSRAAARTRRAANEDGGRDGQQLTALQRTS